MTLYDVIVRDGRLDVVCCMPSCGAHTQLDPRQLLTRRAAETTLSRLAGRLFCAACGRNDVVVGCAAGGSETELHQWLPGR